MYLLELGGEDDAFAACEAASACSAVERLAPGLATARGVSDRVRGLAFTHRVSRLVGTCDPDIESAVATLEAAGLDREGSIAVRAVDVRGLTGVSTARAERDLGGVLVDRGFSVDLDDPDHTLRACFSEGVCALGWLEAESVRDFGDRMPTKKPFFQPGSMDPLFARAVVNIAGARPGATILDPMCGTGGILSEAALLGARVLGNDAQKKMVEGARVNLEHYFAEDSPLGAELADWHLTRGDATRLPYRDGAADAVVFDAPYGRQSKIEHDSLSDLVGDALRETRRIADRGVLVADRSWVTEAEAAGWTVRETFRKRVHRSLDRHVHVLD
ncbi:methyltransferase domain-containing protein [Natronomonas sp. EA1]|uniref:methyltransferase domain-containing protein n=1 Tax=Natronomonas sp. EA1 TaxID=3421655 RepID=UPI003EC0E2F3